MASNAIDTEIETAYNLSWSLRPILILSCCFGINLHQFMCDSSSSKRIQLIKNCIYYCYYSITCLLIHLMTRLEFMRIHYIDFGDESTTSSWSNLFDSFIYCFLTFGSHLILFVIVRSKWPVLLESLEPCDFDRSLPVKLRKISILATILILFLVGLNLFNRHPISVMKCHLYHIGFDIKCRSICRRLLDWWNTFAYNFTWMFSNNLFLSNVCGGSLRHFKFHFMLRLWIDYPRCH